MIKICNINDKITYNEIEVYIDENYVARYKYEDSSEWLDLNDAFLNAVGSFLRHKYKDVPFTDESIDSYTQDYMDYFDMSNVERKMFVNYVIMMLDNIINSNLEKVRIIIKRIESMKEEENEHGEVQR